MDEKTLLYRFPRASRAFLMANAELQNPVPKQISPDALDGAEKGKGASAVRVIVRITSYRTRLLDTDNAFGGQKLLLDCLVESKLIPDDNPEAIDLIVRQQKVAHRQQEKTMIELWL